MVNPYYMASAVVEALKSCGAEVSRERLLDRVSHMEEVGVPMLIPGITLNTTPTDYHAIKQMRLKRFDGARWSRSAASSANRLEQRENSREQPAITAGFSAEKRGFPRLEPDFAAVISRLSRISRRPRRRLTCGWSGRETARAVRIG